MKKTMPVLHALTAGGALVTLVLFSTPGHAANHITKFTWTVPAGTCAVSFSPASPLKLGDVDPSPALGQYWIPLNKTSFNINLSSCAGAGGALRPVVTVSGTTITAPHASIWMFKTAGTSVGFGFMLLKDDTASGSYTAKEVRNGENLYVPKSGGPSWYGTGDTLSGNYSIPLHAAVTCGDTAWCTASALKAGTLAAKITFTFAYK